MANELLRSKTFCNRETSFLLRNKLRIYYSSFTHLVRSPDLLVELVPKRVDSGVVEEVGGVLVKVLVAGVHEARDGVVLVVHEQHLGQDIPGDVGVEVGVLLEQGGQDVDVDQRMQVLQLLAQTHVRPDDVHVGVPGEDGVPDPQMHDLPEVGWVGLVGLLVEEGGVVDTQHLLPPFVLTGGSSQFHQRGLAHLDTERSLNKKAQGRGFEIIRAHES